MSWEANFQPQKMPRGKTRWRFRAIRYIYSVFASRQKQTGKNSLLKHDHRITCLLIKNSDGKIVDCINHDFHELLPIDSIYSRAANWPSKVRTTSTVKVLNRNFLLQWTLSMKKGIPTRIVYSYRRMMPNRLGLILYIGFVALIFLCSLRNNLRQHKNKFLPA